MTPDVSTVERACDRIRQNVSRIVVGQEETVDMLLVALLCEGHVLLEDVPGIGKTTLAKALAASLGCSFRRIQFTPDLLPSDITGTSVFNPRTTDFEFRPGPVFAQIVLADEINRAGPRTQSALLEAMQERQVTADGLTRPLERPFLVLATQNPIELEGTFPLPEAQLDRFLMRLNLGYPNLQQERAILHRFRGELQPPVLEPVLSGDELLELVGVCRHVALHPALEDYLLALVNATRRHDALDLGASPRATLALYHTSQALAAIRGRGYVLPDDVQALLQPVLAHRLVPSSKPRLRGETPRSILQAIAAQVPVPVEEDWSGDATA